jgi:hypothetical protein
MSEELSMRRQPCWLVRRTLETPFGSFEKRVRAESEFKGEFRDVTGEILKCGKREST